VTQLLTDPLPTIYAQFFLWNYKA